MAILWQAEVGLQKFVDQQCCASFSSSEHFLETGSGGEGVLYVISAGDDFCNTKSDWIFGFYGFPAMQRYVALFSTPIFRNSTIF